MKSFMGMILVLSLFLQTVPLSAQQISRKNLISELTSILQTYEGGTEQSKEAFLELNRKLIEFQEKWQISETQLRVLLNEVSTELGLSNHAIDDLQSSFGDYKIATEARIRAVEKELKTWKTVGIVTAGIMIIKIVIDFIMERK